MVLQHYNLLEQLYSFLLTLTVSSTESDICGKLTNACILFTSVSSNEVWNNSISSLSSVVCAICLMDFSPKVGLLIWSVVIKNGTSRWYLSTPSPMETFTSVYLLKGMSVWFAYCTLKESGSSSNSSTGYSSTCGYFSLRYLLLIIETCGPVSSKTEDNLLFTKTLMRHF